MIRVCSPAFIWAGHLGSQVEEWWRTDDSLSELGCFPDPNMGFSVLVSSSETPRDFKRLFGFGFCMSPTHFTRQVLFLNILFPKSWHWDYKVTNGNFQKHLDFCSRWWAWQCQKQKEKEGEGKFWALLCLLPLFPQSPSARLGLSQERQQAGPGKAALPAGCRAPPYPKPYLRTQPGK